MKVPVHVQFEKKVEVEIDPEDVIAMFYGSEREASATQVLRLVNTLVSVLKKIPAEGIAEMTPSQRALVGDCLATEANRFGGRVDPSPAIEEMPSGDNQDASFNRAVSWLETMASLWASSNDIRNLAAKTAALPDETRVSGIVHLATQGYIEGLYKLYGDAREGRVPSLMPMSMPKGVGNGFRLAPTAMTPEVMSAGLAVYGGRVVAGMDRNAEELDRLHLERAQRMVRLWWDAFVRVCEPVPLR